MSLYSNERSILEKNKTKREFHFRPNSTKSKMIIQFNFSSRKSVACASSVVALGRLLAVDNKQEIKENWRAIRLSVHAQLDSWP